MIYWLNEQIYMLFLVSEFEEFGKSLKRFLSSSFILVPIAEAMGSLYLHLIDILFLLKAAHDF
jgi:hypothetical protein